MKLLQKLKESSIVVLCFVAAISLLMLTKIIPFDLQLYLKFLLSSVLVIIGQTIFLIGCDLSLVLMGDKVGTNLIKLKNTFLILLIGFIFGLTATIAEPDVNLFISQVTGSTNFSINVLFLTFFGLGVGTFVILGLGRIIKKIKFKWVILFCYAVALILCFIVPNVFVGIAFDGGGVTTGPITSPFLLALMIGLANIRTNKSAKDDSFGLISIASVGAIIFLLVLGIILGNGGVGGSTDYLSDRSFIFILLEQTKNVLIVLTPIVVIFFILNSIVIKCSKHLIKKIIIGVCLAFIGLVLFLTGINYGFSPIGYYTGEALSVFSLSHGAILPIFIIVVFGFIMVFAEPTLKIFSQQVEKVTHGNLKKTIVFISLSIGIAIALILCVLRVMYNINLLYILAPFLIISLILNFFLPQVLCGIAFDSGGVVTGTMIAAFILPLFIGFGTGIGADSALSGFGVIAVCSVVPIFAMQCLSAIYVYKLRKAEKVEQKIYKKLRKFIDNTTIINSHKSARLSAKVFAKYDNKEAKNE